MLTYDFFFSAAPKGSTFLLHTVAHNPTGVDPTPEQWKRIADVCIERDAIVLMDTAYQARMLTDAHVCSRMLTYAHVC